MIDLHDDDVDRLRISLARISRMVDQHVTGDGMTRTQRSVLGIMAREKSLGMSELAEIEGLNPTMVSRLVGQLESDGLLRRSPGDDRRSVVVEITTAGARLHTRLRRQRTRLFADRLAGLPAGEAELLVGAIPALESLADSLRPSETVRSGAGR
jgi:DNA-binding MarR family transcriptional regulator